jgi:multidrug efflux system outer membrane protein
MVRHKIPLYIFFTVLAAVLCLPAGAESSASSVREGRVINLDEAVELALGNNLNLKKNLIDLAGAEYSADRLWSEVFPTISGSAGAQYASALFTGNGFEMNERNGSLRTGLGITLGLNAGTPFAMKNIKLAYQSNLLKYEDARNQLAIQITKNFFSLIAEQKNLGLLEDIRSLAERQYEKNRLAWENGLVGQLAVMQSRLSLENARYNLSAANTACAAGMGEFLALLGLPQNSGAHLEGSINIFRIDADAEELIREYLPKRPDMISRRQEIERLTNAEKLNSFSSRAPSISLSAQWSGQYGYSGQAAESPSFTDTLRGSATLNIPIDSWIPGTSKSQSIRNAKLSVDKAKLDLQIAEEAAVTQIRSLAANLRNSWDSIEIARLSLQTAERGYELTEQGFQNGTVESLVLEDARNNLASARQRLLQSELSYFNMTLDLSAALNTDWKELKQILGASGEEK